MGDVRLLIQEEGRTARNLVAFNVPVGTNNVERITRKPPSVPRVASIASIKRSIKSSSRVRSASTGRDKKSGKQKLFTRLQNISLNFIKIIKLPLKISRSNFSVFFILLLDPKVFSKYYQF